MSTTLAGTIIDAYCQTHTRLLTLVEKMSDTQIQWQATAESHSIAFHLWHVARWADYMQAAIPGMTPVLQQQFGTRAQLWEREALAHRWGFTQEQLGYAQTGMTMPDDIARTLRFPAKAALLAYARDAFAAVELVVKTMDEGQLVAPEQPQPLTADIWAEGTVGNALAAHVIHDNRHLGAIECLYGLQTGSGTATV